MTAETLLHGLYAWFVAYPRIYGQALTAANRHGERDDGGFTAAILMMLARYGRGTRCRKQRS